MGNTAAISPMPTLLTYSTAALICAALSAALADDPLPRRPPTEASRALDTFRLQQGFRLELLAAEPLVTDPVAMVYDEDGRAFVVEMNDYPFTDPALDRAWEDQPSEPLGRVRLLEDDDGDGVFDRSTVFAEGLSWPTGIACWKGGVFVTATPDVWYLKDTDGDRMADVREQVFTGFRKYNVQAVINNLQWGLDHQLYAAGSSNGGAIERRGGEGRPIALGRNDFRFDPKTGAFQVLSGGARFGNTFDDWGNRFICNIRNPVQHIVFDDQYLAHNPAVAVPSLVHDVADAGDAVPVYRISPAEPWRELNAARLAAENRAGTPRSEMYAVGFVTSAAGATVYRGGAYPQDDAGNVFVGEVAGNLVIRYRLVPDGVTFRAVRTDEDEEFLASTDNWFRPVNFVNAPDGTLHLLDMYRETIEHPWSIPDDIKAQLDLTSGRDRGRIYRLVPPQYADGYTPPPQPRLSQAATSELVALLESPHAWWRETAQRLIHERQDTAAVPLLRKLLLQSPSPQARLHALYALDGLNAITAADALAAMADGAAPLREHGIRLAEPLIRRNASASALHQAVRALANDEQPRVRMQAILTIGGFDVADRPRDALERLVVTHADDFWLRTAALLALPPDGALPLLLQLLDDASQPDAAGIRDLLRQLLPIALSQSDPGELGALTDRLCRLEGLRPGDPVRFDSFAVELMLVVVERPGAASRTRAFPEWRMTAERLTATARTIATDRDCELAERLLSIRWLSSQAFEDSGELLIALIDVQQPPEVQRAAADGLAHTPDPRVADLLLERYARLTPALREQVIGVLLARSDRLARLLEAIETGAIAAADVPPVRRTLLMKSADAAVRARAERVFGGETTATERRAVIERYRTALEDAGDAARGRSVFIRDCANCHRLGGEGHDVGPALVTVRGRTRAEVLEHILDPNREVSPHFLEFVVQTGDGRVQTGIIAAETPTSITLRQPDARQATVLRSEIEAVTSSGKSLMPEGLEQKISPEEMRDLIEFVLGAQR